MTSTIYFKAPGEKGRVPAGRTAVIHLAEQGVAGYALHHNLPRLFAAPRRPGPEVASFLFLALAVWAADKLLPRHLAPDAWTRHIELELPASPPAAPGAGGGAASEFPHRGCLDPQTQGVPAGPGLAG